VHVAAIGLQRCQGDRDPAAVPGMRHRGGRFSCVLDALCRQQRVVVGHVLLEDLVPADPDPVVRLERGRVRGEEGGSQPVATVSFALALSWVQLEELSIRQIETVLAELPYQRM
jgi:hypothetical protein